MPSARLSTPEFVSLMGMSVAMVAFSIDAMLPAFPAIAAELSPADPNRVQLVLSIFMLGMGIGTLVTGPLSDAFGRLPVLTGGMAIYAAGALLASQAGTLEGLLLARAIQGLGAAAPRVVTLALVRDLHEGRRMAQMVSVIMTVFMLVPAVAPSFGQAILTVAGWRTIFLSFVAFALVTGLWLNLRQPETLSADRRRAFSAALLAGGVRHVLGDRRTLAYVAILALGFGQMLALLSSTQQIYAETFGRGDEFPLWFMLTAAIAATGTMVNATLVMRLGMKRLAAAAFLGQGAIASAAVLATASGLLPPQAGFPVFLGWSISIFFMAGLTFGNVNALALQPLGHMAGLASSVLTAASTVLAVLIAVPVGLAFAGTPLPAMMAAAVCSTLCWLLIRTT
jgi:DHA1 family bicyclomycin/chloramphenicol resistance-like MFS transporter